MNANRIASLPLSAVFMALAACAGAPPPAETVTALAAESQEQKPVNPIERQYLADMATTIQQNVQYPYRAFKAGESGIAVVQVRIARDGSVLGAELLRKSGSTSIDNEAIDLFDRIHRFPAVPAELCPGVDPLGFMVPIAYDRNGTASAGGLGLLNGTLTSSSPTWR